MHHIAATEPTIKSMRNFRAGWPGGATLTGLCTFMLTRHWVRLPWRGHNLVWYRSLGLRALPGPYPSFSSQSLLVVRTWVAGIWSREMHGTTALPHHSPHHSSTWKATSTGLLTILTAEVKCPAIPSCSDYPAREKFPHPWIPASIMTTQETADPKHSRCRE